MKLSIVIPTFNRPGRLRACLESLAGQDAAPGDLEVLVCDDGPNEATRRAAQEFAGGGGPPVRYLGQPHRGVGAARNLGLRRARGTLVAFVADDYVLHRSYARSAIEFFDSRPEAGILRFEVARRGGSLASAVLHFRYDMYIHSMLADGLSTGGNGPLRFTYPVPSGGAIFRREVFDRIGPFDESLAVGEDTELGCRCRRAGIEVYYLPRPFVLRVYDAPSFRGSLKQAFGVGWNSYRIKKQYPDCPINAPRTAPQMTVVPQSLRIFWGKCRQSWRRRKVSALFFLPLMALYDYYYVRGWARAEAEEGLPRPAAPRSRVSTKAG
jgi:glycosyltransferase involved in cell wall biosynthesis